MRTANQLLAMGLALAASGLISCSIPKPECTVGQSSTNPIGLTGIAAFAVRYTLVNGTGECANFKGEVVGSSTHHTLVKVSDMVAVRFEREKLERDVQPGEKVTIQPGQKNQVYEQGKEPPKDLARDQSRDFSR